MLSLRALAPLAATAGLMAALPAGAVAAPQHHVQAHAAGTHPRALLFPSIVNTRLVRAQAALDRAAKKSDQGEPAKAIVALTAARKNLSKAWAGAKYVIQTAPPPVPAEDKAAFHAHAFMKSGRVHIYKGRRGKRVRAAEGTGLTYASIYDTAFA